MVNVDKEIKKITRSQGRNAAFDMVRTADGIKALKKSGKEMDERAKKAGQMKSDQGKSGMMLNETCDPDKLDSDKKKREKRERILRIVDGLKAQASVISSEFQDLTAKLAKLEEKKAQLDKRRQMSIEDGDKYYGKLNRPSYRVPREIWRIKNVQQLCVDRGCVNWVAGVPHCSKFPVRLHIKKRLKILCDGLRALLGYEGTSSPQTSLHFQLGETVTSVVLGDVERSEGRKSVHTIGKTALRSHYELDAIEREKREAQVLADEDNSYALNRGGREDLQKLDAGLARYKSFESDRAEFDVDMGLKIFPGKSRKSLSNRFNGWVKRKWVEHVFKYGKKLRGKWARYREKYLEVD